MQQGAVESLLVKRYPNRRLYNATGGKYVNWVGVSGYYFLPGETFGYIFKPVVASVRKFTNDPILIAETASAPGTGQTRRIKDLFAGVRKEHYLGLVWFDHDSVNQIVGALTGE